ncbi:PDZ domain-containing protein [candidate division WOR-3 bacterium]|nr:PDZ domain-containing protein [candidate division WOR-3 bacterium]
MKKYNQPVGLRFIGAILFLTLTSSIVLGETVGTILNRARGWLGVYTEKLTEPVKKAIGVDYGILVTDIVENSPAEKVGIISGDVIMEIDNEKIKDFDIFKNIIETNPDKTVNIKIFRNHKFKTLTLTLGKKEKEHKYEFKFSFPPEKEYKDKFKELKREIKELKENLKALFKELNKKYKELPKEEPKTKEESFSPRKLFKKFLFKSDEI